jgi:transcriptional regulator with XRE-family HTH domain
MSHPEDIELSVGQRITKLCGETPRVQIAALLGMDRKTIGRWEADLALPDGKSLLLMWERLRASPDWVLTGSGSPPPLNDRELRLLACFNAAPRSVQEAVLRALELGEPLKTRTTGKQVFHAAVSQVVQGDSNITAGRFTMQDAGGVYPVTSKKSPKKPPGKP